MKKSDKHDKKVKDETLDQQVDQSAGEAIDVDAKLDEIENLEADTAEARAQDSPADDQSKQIADLTDKYIRLVAEYDNFRKRSRQEKDHLYAQSVTDVVGEWLSVIDNLERAMAISEASDNQEVKQFAEGLTLVMRQVDKTLEKLNVQLLNPLGETFDPNLHSAVLHIDDDQFGAGEIVEVLEKGYARNNKVIRHAIVKVAN